MSTSSVLVVGAVLALVALLGAQAVREKSGGGRTLSYRKRPLLSEAELEFHSRLKQALPDFEIHPQVAFSAFLEPTKGRSGDVRNPLWAKICQKRCDWLVCVPGRLDIVAIVELDDRSHNKKRKADAERDRITSSAGITTIRWEVAERPSPSDIVAVFQKIKES